MPNLASDASPTSQMPHLHPWRLTSLPATPTPNLTSGAIPSPPTHHLHLRRLAVTLDDLPAPQTLRQQLLVACILLVYDGVAVDEIHLKNILIACI